MRWWSNFYHGASNSLECTNLHGYVLWLRIYKFERRCVHRGSNKSISWNILSSVFDRIEEKKKKKMKVVNGLEEREMLDVDR